MAKALQRRRGTNEEHKSFTGLEGEFTYDTTEKRIVAHDGSTKGGIPLAKKAEVQEVDNRLSPLTGQMKSDILEAVEEASGANRVNQVTLEGLQRAIAALEARVQEQVGTVIAFAAESVPNGYLLCDGSAVSRSAYAQLFAVIGTIYGAGDGSSTFNVPDLRARYIEGQNASPVGSVWEAGLPDHQHKIYIESNRGWNGIVKPGGSDMTSMDVAYVYHSTWASESNPIYGRSDTVQPPAVTMRFCIKY